MAQRTTTTPSTPPGVHVDKQTSLLLAPPSWSSSHHGSNNNNNSPARTTTTYANSPARSAPTCYYEDEYLEEDMHTLLSDWMEHDVGCSSSSLGNNNDDDESAVTTDTPTHRHVKNVDPMNTTSPLTARRNNKKKKTKKYRLQWRPPGMMDKKSSSSRRRTRSASPTNITRVGVVATSSLQSNKNNYNSSSMGGGKTNPTMKSNIMARLPPSSSSSSSTPRKQLIRTPTKKKKKKNNRTTNTTSSRLHDDNDDNDDEDDDQSISTFRSFTTFRSSASSIFTTKSTATQKHSNKANSKKYIPSQSALLESLEYDHPNSMYAEKGSSGAAAPSPSSTNKQTDNDNKDKSSSSTLPPLSRYTRRRRRRTALLNSQSALSNDKNKKKYEQETSTTTTKSPSIKQSMSSQSSTDVAYAKTMAVLNDNNKNDNKDLNESRKFQLGNNDKSYDENNNNKSEQQNVTFENMKIQVTNNYDDSPTKTKTKTTGATTPTTASNTIIGSDLSENDNALLNQISSSPLDNINTICGIAPDLDEARYLLDNTCLDSTSLVMNELHDNITSGKFTCTTGSPTSVGRFPNNTVQCNGGSLDECMKKLSFGPTTKRGTTDTNNTEEEDDETVATLDSNNRHSGPIDIDTCTRHLTSTERRHLHAMHTLGHTHLRNAQYHQALEVFSEIVRGQKERHGKRSLQTAVAMHNLGVVCMKCNKYIETVKLCDGAARIRVEHLGRDHVDVACSLSQQGVALMGLREYKLALDSFREALRIRTKASWGSTSMSYHPLIIRLLNNIGCALFELNELIEARVTFENALRMQRELMKSKNTCSGKKKLLGSDDKEVDGTTSFDIDPRDAYHTPLSIALTLTNLGSIHLRLREYDKSLVYFEEAVLIQESVLGENHKIVMNTKESINFVIQSQESQEGNTNTDDGSGVKIDRIGGILPYVSYEESKRIYNKVQNDVSAVIDAVSSSNRCNQPLCDGEDRSFAS